VGCIACSAAGLSGPLASFTSGKQAHHLWLAKLGKHAASKEHERAVLLYLFGDTDGGGSVAAPSSEEFKEVLRLLQKGEVYAMNNHSRKPVSMAWCLQESLLDIDREFVRRAATVSLGRDDRQQRLLIRFTAATEHLELRSGVLGVAINMGADADSITIATDSVFRSFCTPRRPGGLTLNADLQPGETDEALLTHLREVTEMIAVDEEGAEIAAVDIGRGRRSCAVEMEVLTPNLKGVARDKAHGFRRPDKTTHHVIMYY
jgi:hypothetical protein